MYGQIGQDQRCAARFCLFHRGTPSFAVRRVDECGRRLHQNLDMTIGHDTERSESLRQSAAVDFTPQLIKVVPVTQISRVARRDDHALVSLLLQYPQRSDDADMVLATPELVGQQKEVLTQAVMPTHLGTLRLR